MTIHDGYLFEAGRTYVFRHTNLEHAIEVETLRAISDVVNPVVVEALDDSNGIFHLVAGMAKGGTYVRDEARTRSVEWIDVEQLVAWFAELARGTAPIVEVSIADGWFGVDAARGDVIRLAESRGQYDVPVIVHEGQRCVCGPGEHILDAPLEIRLLSELQRLQIAVHWSPWIDENGVGWSRLQQMFARLERSGWSLTRRPG